LFGQNPTNQEVAVVEITRFTFFKLIFARALSYFALHLPKQSDQILKKLFLLIKPNGMKNNGNDFVINCPFFENNRNLLMAGKRKINSTSRPIEKSIYAEDVDAIADKLLSCHNRDDRRSNCKNCRIVATLQKKSVEIYLAVSEPA
jgi:hypothetical protein